MAHRLDESKRQIFLLQQHSLSKYPSLLSTSDKRLNPKIFCAMVSENQKKGIKIHWLGIKVEKLSKERKIHYFDFELFSLLVNSNFWSKSIVLQHNSPKLHFILTFVF